MKVIQPTARSLPESPKPKIGKTARIKYSKGTISIKGESLKIKRNQTLSKVCQKMFNSDIRVGQLISWVDLYQYVYDEEPERNTDWKKLNSIIDRINKRISAKWGIEKVLRIAGGKSAQITRLR